MAFGDRFFNLRDEVCWVDGNGDLHPVESLAPSHILNILNYMETQFFVNHTERYEAEWVPLVAEIRRVYPIFEDIVDEALRRKNPWRKHPDGRTAHCKNLLEAYFVLKRQENPPKKDGTRG